MALFPMWEAEMRRAEEVPESFRKEMIYERPNEFRGSSDIGD